MKRSILASTLALGLVMTGGLPPLMSAGQAHAADAQPASRARADYEARLASVQSLVTALKAESSKPGVADVLKKVDAKVREAAEIAAVGEYEIARSMLDEGYASLSTTLSRVKRGNEQQTGMSGSAALEAEQKATVGKVDVAKLESAFKRREASVVSLLGACERVVKEQGRDPQLVTETTRLLGAARNDARAGRYPQGTKLLDQAYLLLRVGLAEMKGGQEVTASKSFATPSEEFRYEQGRNDDYAQLIAGLVDQNAQRNDWREAAARSRSMRQAAEEAARAGDFAMALKKINESTNEFKTILRRAGFPIV
jgi:hypothetical protein